MKNGTARKGAIFLLPCLLLGLLTLSACDSDSGDNSDELVGDYDLERLEFVPDAASLTSVTVLDTLSSAGLELLGSRFIFRYQVRGESSPGFLTGDFTATGDRIELNFRDVSSDFDLLLLPRSFSLQIGENESALEGSIDRNNVNLQEFDEEAYQSLTSVDGTLEVRFVREGTAEED